ncbi:hypothetical protein [Roseimaritima ulvae]|uniref:Uncharacterized protein n=1 Tax=Roseimaritima ulvae TaxID=980254 RepID=A0A5B9QKX0_9BACT|nr:hypothetical protein [Roseimaritima ulvae]QEG39554.1 hypothetical protein UC8_15490 [Roseimaritima ulvae]
MPRRTVLSILALASASLLIGCSAAWAQSPSPPRFSFGAARETSAHDTSRAARGDAIQQIPLDRLTPQAQARIRRIVDSPTLFRRLPTQRIECDPEMFVFLVRHPEVMVGIWEEMGITKVKTERIGPFQLQANDHAGTECNIDLVYGDQHTHLYYATGHYDGPMSAVPVSGKGVFLLRSETRKSSDGRDVVVGTLDCFIQLDSLGADLLARTLSGLIGRTADNNFEESARFMAQISRASAQNPRGMEDLARRLPQVMPAIRQRFAEKAIAVYENQHRTAALPSENRSQSRQALSP